MCNEISYSKLYFVYILNENCYKSVSPDTKFHQQFNQFNEIEYKFLRETFEAISWLLSVKPISKYSLIDLIMNLFKGSKKSTNKIQIEKLEEILNIDTKSPLYQLYKTVIEEDNK